ncbi:MurR/RpiR family transcriptional regulator [Pyramidobacter sp.]|uniref:MurR/RpiR family transcriptional regulator n=1 Tax=Pyramidobacter sp. TaxID=1943581 RepID=UPI0025E69E51|nr:hypothetical protein [Pyramidobacter sp.]MCI7403082.1 hypothetical protein [Pyramidobacter sp.]MDY3212876.1 hypothetical protein [Pyramidobacter sp.]
MHNDSKSFSVKQKLINAEHNSGLDGAAWELAQYLLLHYNEIDCMKTRDLAMQCHISFSTVRRFCQSLGFDNFSDLRKAKMNNPENQYEIALDNFGRGLYEPRRLYDEILKNVWGVGHRMDWRRMRRLAEAMEAARSIIIFAVRPYSFVLQEFQSQFVALNKSLFIFDDIYTRHDIIARLGSDLCLVTVSLAGGLFLAIGDELDKIAGFKTALYCPGALAREGATDCLRGYDLTFPLTLRSDAYNYLEIYGKYAVGYFFDLLLGEVIRRVGGKKQERRRTKDTRQTMFHVEHRT